MADDLSDRELARMTDDSPKPCPLIYLEIPAPDLEKARKFYTSVFGWKIDQGIPGTSYLMFDDGNLGGGLNPALKVTGQGPNLVLKVEDIPAKLKEITKAGGGTVREKSEIGGGFGYSAVFKDPNGNLLSLWSKT